MIKNKFATKNMTRCKLMIKKLNKKGKEHAHWVNGDTIPTDTG